MIFEDPSRRRWRGTVAASVLLATSVITTIALAVAGVLVPPEVPALFARHPAARSAEIRDSLEQYVRPVYSRARLRVLERQRAIERRRRTKLVSGALSGPLTLPRGSVVAFTVSDDPMAVASLERHVAEIDVAIPDWFAFSGPGCALEEHVDDATKRVLGRSNVLVIPRLANLAGDSWRGDTVAKLLRDDTARRCFVGRVVGRLVALHAAGVNLDIEELQPEDSEPLLDLLVDLRRALHAHAMRLTIDVPMHDPAYDLEYIGEVADAVFVMAYDEHYPSSPPGPVASRDWFVDSIDEVRARVPSDRLVVVIGAYGYDWRIGANRPAESVSFRGAMDDARAANATPRFEVDAENVHFGYTDDDGALHDVWVEDALAAWNQLRALRARGLERIGLWRLGTEDETVWNFLPLHGPMAWSPTLSSIPASNSVDLVGDGEVLSIASEPQRGLRVLAVERDGHIDSATYARVPSGWLVERRGSNTPKEVVLTFDDGPDETWTPRILAALRELRVPAAFFVVGEQVARFPDLVGDEAAAGHLVGNHTYTHPHMDRITPAEASAELAATERLIEGLTGERTALLRFPYTTNVDPDRPEQLAPLREAVAAGYVFVGASVDSEDWQRHGAEWTARHVIDQVVRGTGQIVLMHDGGGDRSQTVAALRVLVPELRRRGYRIVSLDHWLRVPRSDVAASMPPRERLLAWGDTAVARARGWGWSVLALLFFVCTALSIGRIVFLGALTLRQVRQHQAVAPVDFTPLVTVLVPAYNEAKVVARTIASVLASDWPNLEIVVVDDGSTDETASIVEAIAEREPRVRCIRQTNGGKAAAANHGLAEAKGAFIVAVDADTLIDPAAVGLLARHFADPKITAVCGNVEVGNVKSLLTAFQAIEYVTSQNFDRRAFSTLNCVSVVPGALGAWRRESVLAVGGYSTDTLTEDADLTLTLLRAGGHIEYEPDACARTEAPEKVKALLGQRFRWTYGTYQCLWKHRRAFGHGTLGWVGLPNMVLFQLVFPAMSPIGDIVMVLAILRGDWRAFLAGYLAFLVMDLCGSLLAFVLDGKPIRWLALLLVQRFSYRQLMYYVSFRALVAAVRGARYGWRKLDRTGSVT